MLYFQDKAQPETQARTFGSVGFNALLAVDDPEALSLVRQPGSDGFRLDSMPLFQVSQLSGGSSTTSYQPAVELSTLSGERMGF